jgi:hypothetical protein
LPSFKTVNRTRHNFREPLNRAMSDLLKSDLHDYNIKSCRPGWLLAGLVFFGIGFGFVEAVVVVDLRAILSPISRQTGRISPDGVFPMISIARLDEADPVAARLMRVETLREAATLLMLAGVGLASGRTFLQRFSAFLIAFGTWDLCYYLFLKILLGWPASVWTWDVLFLIPVPWAAPVLAPAVVAASMASAGSVVLWWESAGRPFRVSAAEWAAIVAGGLILVVAFCWDWRNLAAGGMPNSFPWHVFLAGEAIALCGFIHASRANRDAHAPRSNESPTTSSILMSSSRWTK